MLNQLTDVALIEVCDEVYEVGRDLDGDLRVGVRYFILAETPDGFRFRLGHAFTSARFEADGDVVTFVQDVQEDRAKALTLQGRIRARLAAGGRLDPQRWTPVQGAYGSRGWDEQVEIEWELTQG